MSHERYIVAAVAVVGAGILWYVMTPSANAATLPDGTMVPAGMTGSSPVSKGRAAIASITDAVRKVITPRTTLQRSQKTAPLADSPPPAGGIPGPECVRTVRGADNRYRCADVNGYQSTINVTGNAR
jgi:hypothetical protein